MLCLLFKLCKCNLILLFAEVHDNYIQHNYYYYCFIYLFIAHLGKCSTTLYHFQALGKIKKLFMGFKVIIISMYHKSINFGIYNR